MGRRQRRREAAALAALPTAAASDQRGARFGIGLIWTVVMVLIVAVLVSAGLLLGGELYIRLHHRGGADQSWLAPVGGVAGVLLGISICHLARGWVQRRRLTHLRRAGVAATGHVIGRLDQYTSNPRGPGTMLYRVRVTWTDDTSGPQMGERRYRFWGRGNRAFETLTERGTEVKVYYPTGRPHRFIVDIPYASTMADQFL